MAWSWLSDFSLSLFGSTWPSTEGRGVRRGWGLRRRTPEQHPVFREVPWLDRTVSGAWQGASFLAPQRAPQSVHHQRSPRTNHPGWRLEVLVRDFVSAGKGENYVIKMRELCTAWEYKPYKYMLISFSSLSAARCWLVGRSRGVGYCKHYGLFTVLGLSTHM